MNAQYIELAGVMLGFGVLTYWWWRRSGARRRFAATINAMAEHGRDEICGHQVSYWLDLLNQGATQPIVAGPTMVLAYKGEDFFFVDGAIVYSVPGPPHSSYKSEDAFFLVAVGLSAVRLLSEEDRIFRRIAGSTDLAVFSIYRWLHFARMLAGDSGKKKGNGEGNGVNS